jgi:hypothetical protein
VYQWPRGSCLMKKTRGRKSRVRVPLNLLYKSIKPFFLLNGQGHHTVDKN